MANSFVTPDTRSKAEAYYPLELYFCSRCFLVQLDEFESATHIFSDQYVYFSSHSTSWLEHAKCYVDGMMRRLELGSDSLVVEVGSNDGYLLQYFDALDVPVLGVEPSTLTAEAAIDRGVPTRIEYLDQETAKQIVAEVGQADLVVANNVLAHNPNLIDFLRSVEILLKFGGTASFEFPHLLSLIEEVQFDTIYHEHFSYFSLMSLINALGKTGLSCVDVEQVNTHGGSLRVFVQRNEAQTHSNAAVARVIEMEKKGGLDQSATYREFASKVISLKWRLLAQLISIRQRQGRIVGYGAPAKANTLLNYCGIRTDIIEYTVDANPMKQGKLLPGTHIPVYEPARIRLDKPDYVVILPWNLRAEIMDQIGFIRDWGGKFIIPIPQIEIV